MKLEIELDLNQIDYEAINKQIQDKIAQIDLKEEYRISSRIDSQIKEATKSEVDWYFKGGTWGGLNNNSEKKIKDEIEKTITELVKPHVENIFNQIPQDELNIIIADLLPKVLVDLINSKMHDVLTGYYNHTQTTTLQICENQIRNILSR